MKDKGGIVFQDSCSHGLQPMLHKSLDQEVFEMQPPFFIKLYV